MYPHCIVPHHRWQKYAQKTFITIIWVETIHLSGGQPLQSSWVLIKDLQQWQFQSFSFNVLSIDWESVYVCRPDWHRTPNITILCLGAVAGCWGSLIPNFTMLLGVVTFNSIRTGQYFSESHGKLVMLMFATKTVKSWNSLFSLSQLSIQTHRVVLTLISTFATNFQHIFKFENLYFLCLNCQYKHTTLFWR